MTDYFIRTTGVDTNNGTTPATAWLTLNKAIGTGAGMVSGDRVFIGGGVYRLTAAQALTLAPTAMTYLIGDPTGAYTGDAGEVVITGYGTSDSTAPFAGNLFSLAAARNFYTFQTITFRCAGGSVAALVSCHDWTFQDCTFYSRVAAGSSFFPHTTTAGVASNLLFERCRFKQYGGSAQFLAITGAGNTVDYDINLIMRSCYFSYKTGTQVTLTVFTGSGTGLPYGIVIVGNHFEGAGGVLQVNSTGHSNVAGKNSTVKYNVMDVGNATVLAATSTAQIVSDFNRNPGGGTYSLTTAGANDNATNAPSPAPDLGQAANWGGVIRPWGTPYAGDPHLGFVTSDPIIATDLIGRTRAEGGGTVTWPVGALGRHDTAAPGSVLSGDSGGWSELVGPGSQEYLVWCGAQATTVSVKVRWDANHGDTNKPQLLIVANPRIGVTAQTIPAVGTAGSAYETLTAAPFSPTAAGLVRVRVVSRAAAGAGILAFDTFSIS